MKDKGAKWRDLQTTTPVTSEMREKMEESQAEKAQTQSREDGLVKEPCLRQSSLALVLLPDSLAVWESPGETMAQVRKLLQWWTPRVQPQEAVSRLHSLSRFSLTDRSEHHAPASVAACLPRSIFLGGLLSAQYLQGPWPPSKASKQHQEQSLLSSHLFDYVSLFLYIIFYLF